MSCTTVRDNQPPTTITVLTADTESTPTTTITDGDDPNLPTAIAGDQSDADRKSAAASGGSDVTPLPAAERSTPAAGYSERDQRAARHQITPSGRRQSRMGHNRESALNIPQPQYFRDEWLLDTEEELPDLSDWCHLLSGTSSSWDLSHQTDRQSASDLMPVPDYGRETREEQRYWDSLLYTPTDESNRLHRQTLNDGRMNRGDSSEEELREIYSAPHDGDHSGSGIYTPEQVRALRLISDSDNSSEGGLTPEQVRVIFGGAENLPIVRDTPVGEVHPGRRAAPGPLHRPTDQRRGQQQSDPQRVYQSFYAQATTHAEHRRRTLAVLQGLADPFDLLESGYYRPECLDRGPSRPACSEHIRLMRQFLLQIPDRRRVAEHVILEQEDRLRTLEHLDYEFTERLQESRRELFTDSEHSN